MVCIFKNGNIRRTIVEGTALMRRHIHELMAPYDNKRFFETSHYIELDIVIAIIDKEMRK